MGPADSKGIQIVSADPKAEIQAFGFSPTFANGTLSMAAVSFHDPDDSVSAQTVYPGVAVGYVGALWGTYQPMVVVQNTAAQARIVNVYRARTRFGNSTYEKVASFRVGPSSVKSLVFDSQSGLSGAWNTYLVESDGQPGDVQTQLWSEDLATGARVLFAGKDSKDDRNAGLHPWTLQNGADDDLYLYNVTESDQPAYVKINNRSFLWKKTFILHAHETLKLSIRDLTSRGLIDDNKSPFAYGAGEVQPHLKC